MENIITFNPGFHPDADLLMRILAHAVELHEKGELHTIRFCERGLTLSVKVNEDMWSPPLS